jgi:1,4-alpha-glucan branching enzyme
MPYDKKLVYYYTLKQLKNAGSPERMRVVMTDNVSTGKPVIAEGILFTYKDRKAGKVLISGNFSSWKMLKMMRGKDGVWFYFLSNNDFAGKVEYKFNVDGLWTEDPYNAFRQDDKRGSYLSVSENSSPSDGRLVTYKFTAKDRVLFRTYKPEARIISIVGDFNGWNPEHDIMKRGNDGIWRLEKRLHSGVYRYKFIIDGEWTPDLFNPESASDSAGDICSIVKIK